MIKKETVLGLVYSPFLNKLYWATKGGGAFLNGVPIHTKPTKTLEKALIIAELGSSSDEEKQKAVLNHLKFYQFLLILLLIRNLFDFKKFSRFGQIFKVSPGKFMVLDNLDQLL